MSIDHLRPSSLGTQFRSDPIRPAPLTTLTALSNPGEKVASCGPLTETNGKKMDRNQGCPRTWTLAAFATGHLRSQDRAPIVKHLAFCHGCRATYLAMQGDAKASTVPRSGQHRAILVVIALTRCGGSLLRYPASPVRRAGGACPVGGRGFA